MISSTGFISEDVGFRGEVRAWLNDNVPSTPLPSGDTPDGNKLHIEWERTLAQARLSAVSWPRKYGGRDANLWQWLIFEEEYYKVGAPSRVTQNGIFLLAPSLFSFGTDAQKNKYLLPMATAEHVWAQGWSEPGAGSDLASVRSRAVRDENRAGWVLNGQKTWSTRAAYCTHMFGLFRTSDVSTRHKGLTYMLIDLSAPGVTVSPFERFDGDLGFADVSFEDVFVPDADVLGDVNGGWSVAMSATNSERGLTLRSPGRFLKTAADLIELYRRSPTERQLKVRDRLTVAWAKAEAYDKLTKSQVALIEGGNTVGSETSINKLIWSELDVELHEIALELIGESALTMNKWTKSYMFSLGGTIYAGTNEIQRNIIAERVLGLPR